VASEATLGRGADGRCAVAAARQHGSGHLYSITHLELVAPSDHARFRQLDVHADFQAGAEFFEHHDWAARYIGTKRLAHMLPMRAIYDTGANVTFSSDWTINALNPLYAVANSVRLRRANGLPDVHAAIKAATLNGARALKLEEVTGSIEVGKSADFVILNRDISTSRPGQTEQAKVLATILAGEAVYRADQ
jgi:hypothetical protein